MTLIPNLILLLLIVLAFTGCIAMLCILLVCITIKNGAILTFGYEEDNENTSEEENLND